MTSHPPKVIFILAIIIIASSLYYGINRDSSDELVLATTTSTYDSGLLDEILGNFEDTYGVEVKVIAVGTGQALTLGKNGDADVLLIHAPSREKTFVANGDGLYRREVMYNQFIICGPSSDPANISGLNTSSTAMERIYNSEATFASRGDDSGTHSKEIELWETAGYDYDDISNQDNSEWYLSLGQGMGDTLRTASEKEAYVIADEGTFYSMEGDLDLEIMVRGDPGLFNQYSVVPVNGSKHSGINEKGAEDFADWIVSPAVQDMIDEYTRGGKKLFTANGGEGSGK